MRVWNLVTGIRELTKVGHSSFVNRVVLLSDRKCITDLMINRFRYGICTSVYAIDTGVTVLSIAQLSDCLL